MAIYFNQYGVVRTAKGVKKWDDGIVKPPINIEGNVNGVIVQLDTNFEQLDTVEMYINSVVLRKAYWSDSAKNGGHVPNQNVTNVVTVDSVSKQFNMSFVNTYVDMEVRFRVYNATNNVVNSISLPSGYTLGVSLFLYLSGSSSSNTWTAHTKDGVFTNTSTISYPYSLNKTLYTKSRALGGTSWDDSYYSSINNHYLTLGGESWSSSTQNRYLGISDAHIKNASGTIVKTLKTRISTVIPTYTKLT